MNVTIRRIKRVTMPSYGPCGELGQYFIAPGDGPRDCIEWETINYNDHGEPYIMVYKDGIEVERINPRYVIAIDWEIPRKHRHDRGGVGNEGKDCADKTDDILAKCMEVISAFIFLAPKWGSALDAVTLHEANRLYRDIEIILEDRKKDQSGFSELKPGIYVKD